MDGRGPYSVWPRMRSWAVERSAEYTKEFQVHIIRRVSAYLLGY